MEETSQLLDLHKKRYTAEIESRNKQITAVFFATMEIDVERYEWD